MTKKMLEAIVTGIVTEVKAQLAEELAPLRTRLDALETKPQLKMRGLWKATEHYRPGDLVVDRDLLWVCTADDAGEPGADYHGWVLAA